MWKIKDLLNEYDLKATRYENKGKAIIIDTNQGKYVIKKKTDNNIFKYLNARSFTYYPKKLGEDDEYTLTEYIDSVDMPIEQQMVDLIELVALLHNKTTFYKEVDLDDYKETYENLNQDIDYLKHYYDDLIRVIETKIYMSPSEYLLARNITQIYKSLFYCKEQLDKWYDIVKEKRKQRFVVLHNNLELGHFIRGKYPYLISWDKAKIDIPIYDLYNIYQKYYYDFDFESIFQIYQTNYPLLEEEKILFFILISLPDKLTYQSNEYETVKKWSKQIDKIYKTGSYVSFKHSKAEKQKTN